MARTIGATGPVTRSAHAMALRLPISSPKATVVATEGGISAFAMWRSAFLAAGIFACVIGAELLIVDAVTLLPLDGAGAPRNVTAPDWAPWSLLSAGAVTIMHCLTAGGGSAPALKKQLPPHHGFQGG